LPPRWFLNQSEDREIAEVSGGKQIAHRTPIGDDPSIRSVAVSGAVIGDAQPGSRRRGQGTTTAHIQP